jgi:hypothetical protein
MRKGKIETKPYSKERKSKWYKGIMSNRENTSTETEGRLGGVDLRWDSYFSYFNVLQVS